MKIGNQEIEVATTPHMGDWMSIAYLPDGTVVAGARADTQAMAEKDLYGKLADRFKPRFDPTRTYEAEDPDFDADEYMTSPNPLGPFGDLLGYLHDGKLELGGNVTRFSHHYVHERSTSVDMEILGIYDEARAVDEMVESLVRKLEEDIKTRMVGWNQKIYRELEAAYDWSVSEEVVAENIMANGATFDENGGDGDEYTYDQLSDEAKETARDGWIEHDGGDNYWAEPVIDEWKELLQNHGFNDVVISYSGFSSQGDGASFTCKWIDFEKYITTPDPLTIPEQERGNRVAESVDRLLEDDPDFDADEYMSSDDSPEEAVLRELRFKRYTSDGRVVTCWDRTEGDISMEVRRMETTQEWLVKGYVLDPNSPNGLTWKLVSFVQYHPDLGNLAEVIQDVEVACRFHGESVEDPDPDFDADEYMAPMPLTSIEVMLQGLGFEPKVLPSEASKMWQRDKDGVLLNAHFNGEQWYAMAQAHTPEGYRFNWTAPYYWHPNFDKFVKFEDVIAEVHQHGLNRLPSRVAEAVNTLLEDDPDFDADEYMSTSEPDYGVPDTLRDLDFLEVDMGNDPNRMQFVWHDENTTPADPGHVSIVVDYVNRDWWVKWTGQGYVTTGTDAGARKTALYACRPEKGESIADMVQEIKQWIQVNINEAVEDPDFDADEYMSLTPDQQLVHDLGFKEIEMMGQVRQYVLDLSAVSQLLLKNYEDNWVVAHTLIDYRFHKTTSENVGTWSPGCQGTLKDMLDKVIAKHKPVQEAVEDPDFDADEYMAIDSSSGLEFKDYLKRKGFQHLHGNSYSKEYRNLNVRVRIFVSTPMDVDGERDGSIFAEAKEATDYYQDHSSVFWKTWYLVNPPEDAVNEVCELASNPNGTLGWLRDAYKQYRERLGESVTEAEEPDLDADDYMSTPDPVSAEQQTLEKLGFTDYSVPMLDMERGDKAWQREQDGTCIYVYYDATLDRWEVTGQVFVVRASEWYSVAGGSVTYKPLMGDVLADVINKMQEKCNAANYSVQLR